MSCAGEDSELASVASDAPDLGGGWDADGPADGPTAGHKRRWPDLVASSEAVAGADAMAEGVEYPDGFSPQLQFLWLVRDAIASVPQARRRPTPSRPTPSRDALSTVTLAREACSRRPSGPAAPPADSARTAFYSM